MIEPTLTINQLAERSGVRASAIRSYERDGLLAPLGWTGEQRRFSHDAVRRVVIIDVARNAGFNRDEIRLLLEAIDGGARTHDQLQTLSQRKLSEVEAMITRIEALAERAHSVREWMHLASGCGCRSVHGCARFGAQSTTLGAGPSGLGEVGAGPVAPVPPEPPARVRLPRIAS